MPIQAVKIPQNVYVEDRIIGPVTLKQLGITGIGAGISYVLYAMATKSGFTGVPTIAICWSPTLVAAMFAFMKINDLSLLQIILLTIENMNKPNIRYWSPHSGLTINLITRQTEKDLDKKRGPETDSAAKLMEVTKQLDIRRKEMNDLQAHADQTPNDLESIKTQLAQRLDQDADEAEIQVQDRTPRPVNPAKIQASGLEPEKSIDAIAHAIPTDNLIADR